MELFFSLLIVSFGIFFLMYFLERRSIFLSFWGLLSPALVVFFIIATDTLNLSGLSHTILVALILLAALIILISPFLFLLALYYNGFVLLRREGFRFHNLLSLGLAFGITFYVFIFPFIQKALPQNAFLNYMFVYIGLVLTYFACLSSLFTFSSFFNFINLFPKKLDYVVVLGAGLNGEDVTPLLAARIDKAIKIYRKNPHSKLIMSGGQGEDEIIAEGEAMARYAIKQGVPATEILVENKSTNTEENLKFSHELMARDSHFAIVTNYYHVFRALLLARKLKIKCIGYGARTKLYFSLNAFIREFVGYLVMSKKNHVIFLGLSSVTYFIFVLIDVMLKR